MMFWQRKPKAPLTPDEARLARLRAFLPHIAKLGWWGSPEGQWGIDELQREVRFALDLLAKRREGQ